MPDFETVSLKEWWKGEISTGITVFVVDRLPIVDIRETQECSSRLLAAGDEGVIVVHLPLSTLLSGERSCELPPRHVSFAVLTEESVLESARAFFGATTSRATQQSRKPWIVPQVLVASDSLWKHAKELGLLFRGKEGVVKDDNIFRPQSRMWQPDPMVKNVLWPLLLQRPSASSSSPPHTEEVWDLGSGAGRDVCFLAENAKALGMSYYSFIGIDNHKGSTKRCLPFWKHRHVEDYTEARNINLNKIASVEEEMNGRSIVCLYAVRFWNPKLVKFIANRPELPSGAVFAVSHFCKPHPGAPWDFKHPKVCKTFVSKVRCGY